MTKNKRSEIAQETTKDQYNFQFLTLREKYVEAELLKDHEGDANG